MSEAILVAIRSVNRFHRLLCMGTAYPRILGFHGRKSTVAELMDEASSDEKASMYSW